MGTVEKSIEVNAPVEVCYHMWTDFENFPRFMKNVEFVRQKGDPNVWHWKVKGPLGRDVEWDAEVDAMQPNQVVSWHSVRNAQVDNAGAVRFEALDNNRTRIHVKMDYNPPAGGVGEFIADIFKNPEKMVEEDLNNFKQLVEQQMPGGVGVGTQTTGTTTTGTVGGGGMGTSMGGGTTRGTHPIGDVGEERRGTISPGSLPDNI